jgi:hypothetical protein
LLASHAHTAFRVGHAGGVVHVGRFHSYVAE